MFHVTCLPPSRGGTAAGRLRYADRHCGGGRFAKVLAAMGRSLVTGLIAFGLSYLVIGLGASVGLDFVSLSGRWITTTVEVLLVVPSAVALGLRAGRLTVIGVAACGLVLALSMQLASVYLLGSIARAAGGHFIWSDLYREIGYTNPVIDSLVMMACPAMWLLLFRRFAPGLTADYSSRQTHMPHAS